VNNIQTVLLRHRLTTAKILYHMPDHPTLLQNFIWQYMDIAPNYPRPREFLDFWEANTDGRLHLVTDGGAKLNTRVEITHAEAGFRLH
jgi:uncharacterized protein Usg